MAKNNDSDSPGWSASFFMQTTEDVAKAVAAAAATVRSPRPSVVFSTKDENNGSQLEKLQRQVTRVLKGFSPPPEVKARSYNPEVLTSQKRQWASFQLQSLDHKCLKEPSRLFESMVVVGLHPNSDVKALQRRLFEKNTEGIRKWRSVLHNQQPTNVELKLEPQVLFVYPPKKQLPLKYKDLLSFCFPGGLEVHAMEKTPSMSELNEILLGQEHLKQSDLSFVFRLQVADDSTLYGCCVLVEEIIQKPSRLISVISDEYNPRPSSSRFVLTAPRCYCILSRLPFFDLHFGILKSIFTEERLERLTEGMGELDFVFMEAARNGGNEQAEEFADVSTNHDLEENNLVGNLENSPTNDEASATENNISEEKPNVEEGDVYVKGEGTNGHLIAHGCPKAKPDEKGSKKECEVSLQINQSFDGESTKSKDAVDKRLPGVFLPLLHYQQCESSDSSPSFQGSPSGDQNFRCDVDEIGRNEASSSGREHFSDHDDILELAKDAHCGSLRIICEYYHLHCPERGSSLTFHPLEHLHPLKFHRSCESVLQIAGTSIDTRTCSTSLEIAEAHNALFSEEEAIALSVWTIASICGSLRLENILTMFAGALLEKQIVVVCSNLGILSAVVLSIVPLIRPYQWQSLLMPVLPNDMLDFLDAPVPYIVGVKNKTAEVQSKLANVILVDVNKNQVKSPSIPQLPQHKELLSSLRPHHAKLVGESYLAKKRLVHECTDAQAEAAKCFLEVLRNYLDSLCSNLRAHTITNVQSNNDKVSLLLKESFIESFPARDRPFMKLFVDTQLFSVHTDLVLSFYQKE
ncbi:hypothetical protein AMTRI_Chr04g180270 [Amborella trichopoda]